MAMFTMRTVRQFYVANVHDATGATPGAYVGTLVADGLLHLKFTNVDGVPMLSDGIPLDKIRHAVSVPYSAKVLRQDKITIATPVVGQEYVLGVHFRSWISGSPESTYFKHIGAYRAKTGDTAVTIVDKLVELGTKNFAREAGRYLTFAKEAVTNKLVITEVAQPWYLGRAQGRNLDYYFIASPIIDNGVEVSWASFETTQGKPGVGTGQQVADMEYFYIGEKGDMHGYNNWPMNFPMKYLANPSLNYNTIDLAFYNTYDLDSVQAAEKQLTIVCPVNTGVAAKIITDINAVKSDLLNTITD